MTGNTLQGFLLLFPSPSAYACGWPSCGYLEMMEINCIAYQYGVGNRAVAVQTFQAVLVNFQSHSNSD